jgi:hypothetical protein
VACNCSALSANMSQARTSSWYAALANRSLARSARVAQSFAFARHQLGRTAMVVITVAPPCLFLFQGSVPVKQAPAPEKKKSGPIMEPDWPDVGLHVVLAGNRETGRALSAQSYATDRGHGFVRASDHLATGSPQLDCEK